MTYNNGDSMQKVISTQGAPAAIGPYSQAIVIGDTLYASGQIPIDPETGNLIDAGIAEQTRRVMINIGAVLSEARLDYSDVVKTTVFLTDIGDFATVNGVYAEYFKEPYPARSCVQVAKLPKNAGVEIEIVAKLRRA